MGESCMSPARQLYRCRGACHQTARLKRGRCPFNVNSIFDGNQSSKFATRLLALGSFGPCTAWLTKSLLQKLLTFLRCGGSAPLDSLLELAAAAASASQLRTFKPSRLLSQPPEAWSHKGGFPLYLLMLIICEKKIY